LPELRLNRCPLKTEDQLLLNANILERRRDTQSQTGLTRHQRRENIRGAFVVAKAETLSGREVLVVDDVFTTGTTVSECGQGIAAGRRI